MNRDGKSNHGAQVELSRLAHKAVPKVQKHINQRSPSVKPSSEFVCLFELHRNGNVSEVNSETNFTPC